MGTTVLGQIGQVSQLEVPQIEWSGLIPLLVLAGAPILMLTIAAVTSARAPRGAYATFTVVTSAVVLVTCIPLWSRVTDPERGPFNAVADAVTIDGFSIFFTVLIAVSVALAALLADDYLRREGLDGPELYVLMMLSGVGGVLMAMSNDMIVLFLGLETLSIALYVMCGYHLRRLESQESAIKYFVLGSFSSAFLLYGIALVYGATGSTNFSRIGAFLAGNVLEADGLLLAGFALLLVGLGFKIAAVPFHVWTPDVYQGAPTPVTAFAASASKAAGFAALIRVFTSTFEAYRLDWQPIIWVLAVLTLAVGSILAIVQDDVKRMMAYSSISHAGFILIGVHAATDRGVAAALFYLLAYAFMVIGSFAVITLVGRAGDAAHGLDAYRGLGTRRPALALVFAVFLLAQAGVPLTSGFLAKFYVISAAVEDGGYVLAIIAMVSAVVAAFLYLRIIIAMYMGDADMGDAESGTVIAPVQIPLGAGVAIGIAAVFTLAVGILPGTVIDFARDAVPVLLAAGD
ncbi:MAG TPA: NADH-quinone oxidoreductase subunit N [Acidimicrobiales bacterium]|nr:NADH-quinone oxidoreductase subunit N [Acidimicrobiales bacterium]